MCFGLPGGVTMVSVLVAKLTGAVAVSPASTALVMFLVSAEANTSACAPWVSWATRSDEPAKLNSTLVPGCSASNFSPSSVNVFFNEAAAKTVMSPVTGETAADAVVFPAGSESELEQPATRVTAASAASAAAVGPMRIARELRVKTFLLGFRRSRWSP
jgi:hypothetical protein